MLITPLVLYGTPPRRRGGPGGGRADARQRRNTPTSAGRTSRSRPSTRLCAEHPRVGGEDDSHGASAAITTGTPPRRRGGRRRHRRQHQALRNTPASAGRACSSTVGCRRSPGHLRAGEEDAMRAMGPVRRTGIPPASAGRQAQRLRPHVHVRNIPASAGRTSRGPDGCGLPTEHPRVGGEDRPVSRPICANTGTPPRRREGPRHRTVRDRPARNTPASARRTPGLGTGSGNTAEHPRVGGEDGLRDRALWLLAGTLPRRRGGRLQRRRHDHRPRNTLASAGRTSRRTSEGRSFGQLVRGDRGVLLGFCCTSRP